MLKVEGRKPHGERTKMLETKDPRLDGNISFGEKKGRGIFSSEPERKNKNAGRSK